MKLLENGFLNFAVLTSVFLFNVSQAATLVHTNDVFGDIEPCGCRTNPQGGMARKANLLKRMKDEFTVQLDAGDLLFSTLDMPELVAEQGELQAEYLLKAMDLVHHDAVVPGEKDFALGFQTFERLRKKTKVQFLAANLKLKKGGKYLPSHAIFSGKDLDGKSIKIAVFGLVGKSLEWPKELEVLPPQKTARSEVTDLKKKADFIVALTHQGVEEDEKLAEKVQGIDIIIGGHSQSFLQTPKKVGKTTIFQSSFRNQYVGVIPLTKPLEESKYQLVGLDAGYDSPANQPSAMDGLVKDFKKAIAELNSRQEVQMAKKTQQGMETGGSQKFQTFPKCAECHYSQFDFWRKTTHAKALDPLIQKQQAKNKECLTCHTLGLGDKQGFQNVNILAEVGKLRMEDDSEDSSAAAKDSKLQPLSADELDPFLNALHEAETLESKIQLKKVTSTPQPIKEVLRSIHRAWTPVQCENCHLPGGDHPFSGEYSKKVEKEACLKCHTAERAPEWYTSAGKPNLDLIEAKRKMVSCPAGGLDEAPRLQE